VAAQIATFPLTSFYFSQFPTYFWLTNIFIIPAVAFLTPVGIILLFVNKIPVVAEVVSVILNFILKYSYKLLSLIEQLPYAVFQVTVNQVQLWLIFGLIVTSYFVLTQFNARYLKTMLVILLLFCISVLVIQVKLENTSQIIVYNSKRNSMLHLIQGKENYVISEERVLPDELQYSPFIATQKKLGLKNPVMLIATDSIRTKNIFLQNRKILFQGQTIFFGNTPNQITENKDNSFLINPGQSGLPLTQPDSATVIITSKRYLPRSVDNDTMFYCTFSRGAYRKVW